MSRMLVITAATGKKSGGAFAEILGAHMDMVHQLFPDGLREEIAEYRRRHT